MVSTQPRKQRKALYNAPQHVSRKQVASHLSEELLLKYNRRSLTLVVGDEVKVLRGDFAGKNGKVLDVDVPARRVTVEGIINKKADGTEVARSIAPSNLLIVKLNLEDKYRRAKLEATAEAVKMGTKAEKVAKPKAAKAAKAKVAKEVKA